MNPEPNPALEDIHREIRSCRLCDLARGRTNAVPGHGRHDADIMLVGEGPGHHEDRQGLPFVGAAGQFLNELLERAGIRREDVFVTNVVKCRPPSNRDPKPEEIAACNEYLLAQIALIKPRAIFTLGRFALATLIDEKLTSISRVHGKAYRKSGMVYVPLYHPAAALHNERLRETIVEDMARAAALLRDDMAPSETADPSPDRPQQLGLLDMD
ncbi:MAG: uracil-DNA glycosylase [Armatimonadota bacterium]|nr:MAG: uracil-DNA glycosylase [Armatimonadota bacterium]